MIDVVIVDEMYFLHLLSDLTEAFGFVSRSIFRKLCSSFPAKKIDNAFDTLVTPWIKDNERDIRAQGLNRHTLYELSSPVQKRPIDFLGALRNNAFQQANANIIQDFQIYATCGNQLFYFELKVKKWEK